MKISYTPEYFGIHNVAAVSPNVALGNPQGNASAIIRALNDIRLRTSEFIVFPELSLTGYTIGDLFFQDTLYVQIEKALNKLEEFLKNDKRFVVVGLPLNFEGRLYNCAAVIASGKICGIVPKSNIPNYQEFYEKRWFHSGEGIKNAYVSIGKRNIPFGTDLIFCHNDVKVGLEICEDLWVPSPPSSTLCRQGAELILNLSATDEVLGKYAYLRNLVASQSGRCRCCYAYASAGAGESSTDLVFSGNDIIAYDGAVQAETKRFDKNMYFVTSWIDFEKLRNDRKKFNSFHQEVNDDIRLIPTNFVSIDDGDEVEVAGMHSSSLEVDSHPFVPKSHSKLYDHCEEIIAIQSAGLAQRLRATGCENIVVGISGGLDSTLALLIAVKTFNDLSLPLSQIHGVTMPGEATSSRTYLNSLKLMHQLKITHLEISVREAVELHFRDIEHDPKLYDAVYENSQARERTQILMDLANKFNGMVLGTGDLSELALGWCTYNGDHMSMYNVNASVPKTLVRHIVKWFAKDTDEEGLRTVLEDIVATPISPELVPSRSEEEISQITEDIIGPYELHDFFLYHLLRNGFRPTKIFWLATQAFRGKYEDEIIKKWLVVFYRRFFSQQFKRSCMPDGPKVGSVCLSPRGDWRMPSDISGKIWIDEALAITLN